MSYQIKVTRNSNSKINSVDFNNLPFGRIFTDHMFVMDYAEGEWKDLRIEPFGPLMLHPATSSFHYGQAIFEGLKAQKDKEGNVLIFRPDMNAERLNLSAERMAMPSVPADMFIQAVDELLKLDYKWIPEVDNASLYIRPFMFATDEYVGIKESDHYKFVIFCSPVGNYYSAPVKVYLSEEYIRAFPGGTGTAKCAGNYGATLYPLRKIKAMGYDQMLWLDGIERKYIQESGTMNVFFIIDDVVITPNMDQGTILNGVTRDSIITLVNEMGIAFEERPITIDEIFKAHTENRLSDAFGAGTAATIAQIVKIGYRDTHFDLPPIEDRALSNKIKETLYLIKRGEITDTHHWNHVIPMAELVH